MSCDDKDSEKQTEVPQPVRALLREESRAAIKPEGLPRKTCVRRCAGCPRKGDGEGL
jgi:hypothetical protein